MNAILQQPEFIFEKPSYDKYHKSRLPQQPLPGYAPAILPAELFLLIVNSFIETYARCLQFQSFKSLFYSYGDIKAGETDYVQKLSIEPDAHLRVMGDLHGCAQAFVRMLSLLMNEGFIDGGLRLIGQKSYLVFLGDFVDYGRNGCETLALMMLCRCINPQRVLVCRGNHEDCSIYARPEYGFLLELQQRYADHIGPLRVAIDSSFECMPLAIFAGIQGRPEGVSFSYAHTLSNSLCQLQPDFLSCVTVDLRWIQQRSVLSRACCLLPPILHVVVSAAKAAVGAIYSGETSVVLLYMAASQAAAEVILMILRVQRQQYPN
jgi:hypothetical protein